MDTLSYKTKSANKATVQKEWYVVDATDQVLGRMCAQVAKVIRGKHKPSFTPHVDCGDKVIIINADKVKLTGNKMTDKTYVRHTGYPGGQRKTTPEELLEKHPARIVENAIKGMVPKNKLGRQILKNVFVYAGPEHSQDAQKPKELKF
ncbi:MAG: 50S ribosomal protein L13 [Bacteroidales bacterium]|nr:50S ribosomal protein L13 [Bacteroidales bacterium]NLK82187.1 50S ribosomal protein L13 [Bacteroidales bacterium]HPY82861.1 50S ribosomal protein L13 [Bacteroidales bacterium]